MRLRRNTTERPLYDDGKKDLGLPSVILGVLAVAACVAVPLGILVWIAWGIASSISTP